MGCTAALANVCRRRHSDKPGAQPMPSTRFTDPAAVDAWDQWFRWRHAEGLRDRTIDATWARVAHAVADAGDDHASMGRYIDAFSRWQLLPDERLLRSAGTARHAGPLEAPVATLNVSAFVASPLTRQAQWDMEGFARVAALSVRLLDDALVAVHGATAGVSDLRIGVMGFADAMVLLGIGYADAEALQLARRVGAALALGTLRGTVELAHERGAIDPHPDHRVALWRDRGIPQPLIDDALRWGVRHARLSAIERQPRLALLANNASDALDPAPARHRPSTNRGARGQTTPHVATVDHVAAQLALRAAIQPWIDAPIAYPLVTPADPDAQPLVECQQPADSFGLCDPRSRNIPTQ